MNLFLFAEDAYHIEFSPDVAGISRYGEHQVLGFWAIDFTSFPFMRMDGRSRFDFIGKLP